MNTTRHTFLQGIDVYSMEFHVTFWTQVDVTSEASTYILPILFHQLVSFLIFDGELVEMISTELTRLLCRNSRVAPAIMAMREVVRIQFALVDSCRPVFFCNVFPTTLTIVVVIVIVIAIVIFLVHR